MVFSILIGLLIVLIYNYDQERYRENDVITLINRSDSNHGKLLFNNYCGHCHSTIESDHKIGPSLYNIVGQSAAEQDGFLYYSTTLLEADISWNYLELFKFIRLGSSYLNDTKMAYDGIASDNDTAAIILFLKNSTKE